VLIHGGPGFSSFYLKLFEELGNNRQVVRYDQLGSGKSDIIADTTMSTINHFVEELELLRIHLGLSKGHLLGHSWGTIIALE
jgi:proline iminopeptidase